jgi:hypothetical protein
MVRSDLQVEGKTVYMSNTYAEGKLSLGHIFRWMVKII